VEWCIHYSLQVRAFAVLYEARGKRWPCLVKLFNWSKRDNLEESILGSSLTRWISYLAMWTVVFYANNVCNYVTGICVKSCLEPVSLCDLWWLIYVDRRKETSGSKLHVTRVLLLLYVLLLQGVLLLTGALKSIGCFWGVGGITRRPILLLRSMLRRHWHVRGTPLVWSTSVKSSTCPSNGAPRSKYSICCSFR
jgi:hypothetical protein